MRINLGKGDEAQEEVEGEGHDEVVGDGQAEPPGSKPATACEQGPILDWLLYGLLGIKQDLRWALVLGVLSFIPAFIPKYREIAHHPLITVHIVH